MGFLDKDQGIRVKYNSADVWESLPSAYIDTDTELTWNALFTMTDLFQSIAPQVAEKFQFSYPLEEYQRVRSFLEEIKRSSDRKHEM